MSHLRAHLDALTEELLLEATDFQVRAVAAMCFDKDGKPNSKFMANPKGWLRQSFAKATATEKASKRDLSADAKRRDGFQKRLRQYEKALKIARSAPSAKAKKARKPLPEPGKILKFPVARRPTRRPTGPAAAAMAAGRGPDEPPPPPTTPFRLVASVQQTLEGLRLLLED
jgi:hypothetical protein